LEKRGEGALKALGAAREETVDQKGRLERDITL
jgi:hypothetical protein